MGFSVRKVEICEMIESNGDLSWDSPTRLGFGTSQNKEIGCSELGEKMGKAKWPFSMEEF